MKSGTCFVVILHVDMLTDLGIWRELNNIFISLQHWSCVVFVECIVYLHFLCVLHLHYFNHREVECCLCSHMCALWTACLWSEMCESLTLTDEMVKHKGRRCCMTALCTHLWSLGFVLEQTCGFWLVEVVEYLMIVLTWICVCNEDISVSLCSSAELVFLLWTCWRWDSFMLVNCFQDSHITMMMYLLILCFAK